MSQIPRYLDDILSAVYGRDVRQSIHDAIEECWIEAQGGGSGSGGRVIYSTFLDLVQVSANLMPGAIVETSGYYSPGDQGGATYRITTAKLNDWDLLLSANRYAVITNTDFVTYGMFGAKLNGVDDDGPAMRMAHKYADSVYTMDGNNKLPIYTCRVENHRGIIYKKDADAISFRSDADLSGSILKLDDINIGWYGIYVWGDNDSLRWLYEPSEEMKASMVKDSHLIVPTDSAGVALPGNIVIRLEEEPYAARDDAGFSYTVAKKELLIHDLDGICSSPLATDWANAGGMEMKTLISDLVNGGYKTETLYTNFKTSYNYVQPRRGTFIGCEVSVETSPNKYQCVLWVKRHNCEVRDWTFIPKVANLHNNKYKNTMIYLWDSYNVRVSGIQGFNGAGKKQGATKATSGYILRLTNCSDVVVSDCRLQGYWGATAMDSVKNIRFERCHINRLDVHDYFSNLWADKCVFYNSTIQIGFGSGLASFTNCKFHLNPAPGDSYPANYLIALNMTYGRIFEGTIYIDNCQAICNNLPDNEFNLMRAEFSPTATTTTKHSKFPEIVATNLQLYSKQAGTHYSLVKIAGSRSGKTSSVRPTNVPDYVTDGNISWKYYGRGLDWNYIKDNNTPGILVDQILRVSDRFITSEGFTQFYNKRYYKCTVAGDLGLSGDKPTDKTGAPFTNGSATLVYVGNDILWKSKFNYSVNNLCIVEPNEWFPPYMFRCERGGMSNGFFPTHGSGQVLDGINDPVNEPNGVWWEFAGLASSMLTDWEPNLVVTQGQRILVDNRLYEITTGGQMAPLPPYDTFWFGITDSGTAKVKFIGKVWAPQEWFDLGSYTEARGRVYKVVNHPGITSGIVPVQGNKFCVDGDIIWEHVSGTNTLPNQFENDTWGQSQMYNLNDQVISNANTYKAVFDGRMELPHRSFFKNIVTNMTNGQLFWFFTGTSIPTRSGDKQWNIIAEDCEGIARAVKFPSGMTKYFGYADNPVPTGILATTGSGGGGLTDADSDSKIYGRKDGAWVEVPSPDEAANGLPTGGTTGQILKKSSSTNYAVEWANEPSEPVPTGGTTGQLLAKASNTDLDLEWVDAPSGGGGSNDSTVGNVRLIKDVGRLYTPGNSGILRISLGASPSGDTFVAGTVFGYRHDTRQRWQVDFAGYTGASWGTLKVVLSPNCPFTDVRRAMWNGFPCILLGQTTTTWGHQMCVIPEVIVAYLGMASIAATWPMAIVNTETGITSIVAADEKKILAVVS